MRMFKVLSISIIATVIAVFATVDIWHLKSKIHITFNSENAKNIEYRVYYTETLNTKFNGEQVVKKTVPVGTNNIDVILPTDKVARLRLDFGKKPGTIYISNLKLTGDKVINFDDFKKFAYSNSIEKHKFLKEKGMLEIVANQGKTFMVYKDKLDVYSKVYINWSKLLQIAFGAFFVVLFLGLFIARKKVEKKEEKSPKISKDKK